MHKRHVCLLKSIHVMRINMEGTSKTRATSRQRSANREWKRSSNRLTGGSFQIGGTQLNSEILIREMGQLLSNRLHKAPQNNMQTLIRSTKHAMVDGDRAEGV
jgi:hypothetical protein